MATILLNNEGESSTSEAGRSYSPPATGHQFFLINDTDANVSFNVSNATNASRGPHHKTTSDGKILVQSKGLVEFRSTGAVTVTQEWQDTNLDILAATTFQNGFNYTEDTPSPDFAVNDVLAHGTTSTPVTVTAVTGKQVVTGTTNYWSPGQDVYRRQQVMETVITWTNSGHTVDSTFSNTGFYVSGDVTSDFPINTEISPDPNGATSEMIIESTYDSANDRTTIAINSSSEGENLFSAGDTIYIGTSTMVPTGGPEDTGYTVLTSGTSSSSGLFVRIDGTDIQNVLSVGDSISFEADGDPSYEISELDTFIGDTRIFSNDFDAAAVNNAATNNSSVYRIVPPTYEFVDTGVTVGTSTTGLTAFGNSFRVSGDHVDVFENDDEISINADGSNSHTVTGSAFANGETTVITDNTSGTPWAAGDSIYEFVDVVNNVGAEVVFSNIKARHGTSIHDGDELYIVEAT